MARYNHNRGRRSQNNSGNRNRRFRGKSRKGPASFDPTHLVKQSQSLGDAVIKPKTYTPVNSFRDFDFDDHLHTSIDQKGYTQPTPIQDQAIPHITQGKDIVGLAGTGTGKTAAFLLPLIQKVRSNPDERVLVVAPTRELAVQIKNELRSFTESSNIYSVLCIGGTPLHRQAQSLQRKPSFVIGTPGRLIDLHKRRKMQFGAFKTLVLDEVDRMLDMGFIPDVTLITNLLPDNRQTLFFSATLPQRLERLIPQFLNQAHTVEVERQTPAASVDQQIIDTKNRSKVSVLHELLNLPEFKKVLVFGRTKHGLNKLATNLYQKGFKIATIHGNKNQNQRQRALKQFRANKVSVLLATDVASRGLDIDDVTHVINFDLPQTKEDYIHRIGRTGRANAKGVAISFVN